MGLSRLQVGQKGGIMLLGPPEDAPNADFDRHSIRVLAGRTVPGFERLDRPPNSVRVPHDLRGPFHGQPACPVHLTDNRKAIRVDVMHFLGAIGADDSNQSAGGVICEGDRNHMGSVVAAQCRQGRQMPGGEKLKLVSGELGGLSHREGRYLARALG